MADMDLSFVSHHEEIKTFISLFEKFLPIVNLGLGGSVGHGRFLSAGRLGIFRFMLPRMKPRFSGPQVTNLARTMEKLKAAGDWLVGTSDHVK